MLLQRPNGFDHQERNLTFLKTDFQALKLKFYACSMKRFFLSSSQIKHCATLTTRKYFYTSFLFGTWLSNLHVKMQQVKLSLIYRNIQIISKCEKGNIQSPSQPTQTYLIASL